MKTRFAPSPTGYLHKGHIWSALCVSAVAKAKNASVHLRLEDHDGLRCSKHFSDIIRKDLEWLGFEWQSESVQSERNEIYERYFKILQERNLLYDVYKTEQPKTMFKNTETGGDFAVKDALGQWTYMFAVVVDDFEEGMDLIIRGEDLEDSIDKQISLAKVLGRKEMPQFFRHSLLYDSNGKKLSKRDGSEGIFREREAGISAKKVIGDLCRVTMPGVEIPDEISWGEAAGLAIGFLSLDTRPKNFYIYSPN
jgi:glutamyl-tRNA synthetase/glutamyl-Q tRNA(Asp) synthetase